MKQTIKKKSPACAKTRFQAMTFLTCLLILLYSCKKEMDTSVAGEYTGPQMASDDHKVVDVELITDELTSPVAVVAASKDDRRLFIVDQIGKIWIIDKLGNKLATPFLDISSKLVTLNPNFDERGLLGLAFHPDYKHNGKFYVYYSAPRREGGPAPGVLWNNLIKLSEFRVSSNDENLADAGSERVVLQMDDPQSNHNGGTIQFGPADGYLYIAIGDGGGANDTPVGHVPDWYLVNAGGNGQDVEANLFGNILRIDVNGDPYSIPPDNPFVGEAGLDEVYAYGLRNPFRFSIDQGGSHDLIAGDVGQLLYEEIDLITKGGNYGWNVKEGYSCFNAAGSRNPFTACPGVDNFGNPLIDPVIVLNNFQNPVNPRTTAIMGGNVYRGSDIKALKGKYVFGTYSQAPTTTNGELFVAEPAGQGPWSYTELSLKSSPNDIGALLKGMGEDSQGELYLTTSLIGGPSGTTGKVWKLVEVKDKKNE
jgi:glucose/arabinose dehydrogenase